jgi:NAD(P)-dependent dehydrogenase (short-subunit alcohol dehydrogenase family)
MKFDFRNKVFVITGCAGGIGSHLASVIAETGRFVVGLDLN